MEKKWKWRLRGKIMNEGKGKKIRKLHKKWIKRPYNCNVIEMYKYFQEVRSFFFKWKSCGCFKAFLLYVLIYILLPHNIKFYFEWKSSGWNKSVKAPTLFSLVGCIDSPGHKTFFFRKYEFQLFTLPLC